MMKQVMDTIGSVLYERLKKKVCYYEAETTLSMVEEDAVQQMTTMSTLDLKYLPRMEER